MALNWDLNKVKDCDETCYLRIGKEGEQNYQLSPTTNNLISIQVFELHHHLE